MRRIAAIVLIMSVLACAGCGSSSSLDVPARATQMDQKLRSNMTKVIPMAANIEAGFIFVLNPGIPAAQGVSLQTDLRPGAAPNSFTFGGAFDGNSDGFQETQMQGGVTFASNPANDWSGLSAHAAMDVNIPIVGHVYHADLVFTLNDSGDGELSGSGAFTDPLSGDVTSVTTGASSHLTVKAASGAANAVSNACGYSIGGRLLVEVESDDGTLSSEWNFAPNSSSIAIRSGTFLDTAGKSHAMPDSTLTLQCGGTRTVNNWVGVYLQNWACIPWESGQASLTLSVVDADTVSIADVDPPGSGQSKTYGADVIGGDAQALRGFFNGGIPTDQYREDFNWILGKDGNSFSQSSIYTYTVGPNIGSRGMCVGSARKS